MDQLLPGFESIKTQIPEFVLKLYHILEVFKCLFRKNSFKITYVGMGIMRFLSKVEKNFKIKSYHITSDINTSHPSLDN
jgi:hypothetical protein